MIEDKDWRAMLEHLTPREQRIMILRYGLSDGHFLSVEETSKRLGGVPPERVRQIEQRAWRKLKDLQ